jgi:hypothetical protein
MPFLLLLYQDSYELGLIEEAQFPLPFVSETSFTSAILSALHGCAPGDFSPLGPVCGPTWLPLHRGQMSIC